MADNTNNSDMELEHDEVYTSINYTIDDLAHRIYRKIKAYADKHYLTLCENLQIDDIRYFIQEMIDQ